MLRGLSKELHNGRGFFVLRTIPVDNYSREDNIIIYAGVSSYVGELRGVQDAGNKRVLSHVKDLTLTHSNDRITTATYTTDKMVFHTDPGDIVSLFSLDVAAHGGASRISSSWKVYNELAATRPDLIRTLAEPWSFSQWVPLNFFPADTYANSSYQFWPENRTPSSLLSRQQNHYSVQPPSFHRFRGSFAPAWLCMYTNYGSPS